MADQGDPHAPVRRRSWVARIIAPLALVAALVAVFLIISGSLGSDDDGTDERDGGARSEREAKGSDADKAANEEAEEADADEDIPETYEVQSGDSFSTIGAEFGLSVEKLERLNPDVDSTALATGQILKLR